MLSHATRANENNEEVKGGGGGKDYTDSALEAVLHDRMMIILGNNGRLAVA